MLFCIRNITNQEVHIVAERYMYVPGEYTLTALPEYLVRSGHCGSAPSERGKPGSCRARERTGISGTLIPTQSYTHPELFNQSTSGATNVLPCVLRQTMRSTSSIERLISAHMLTSAIVLCKPGAIAILNHVGVCCLKFASVS